MKNLSLANQPLQLYPLSAAYMGERFGYFMMQSVLILYTTKMLLFSVNSAYSLFAGFSALMYLAPLVCGWFIDRYFGNRLSVMMGGILLSLGFFSLGMGGIDYLYLSLAIIITGKGFYAPSIVTAIGDLYQSKDPRREGGFSVMYAAINISAIIPPLIAASVIWHSGWWELAFIIAGIGNVFGTVLFYFCTIRGSHFYISQRQVIRLFVIMIGSVLFFTLLIRFSQMTYLILIILSSILMLYAIKQSFNLDTLERNRLYICFTLTAFSIVFFVLSQQSAMSLTIFTEYNVNRNWHFGNIPTFIFLSLNPMYILMLGPLFSLFWTRLNKKNINPTIPTKFAMGTIFLGVGFIILLFAISYSQTQGKIHFSWVMISYLFQSVGELLICPIGLAMITELVPKQMVSFMVGVWYLTIAAASGIAGWVSQLTNRSLENNSLPQSSAAFAHVFGILGWIAIFCGILLYIFFNFSLIPTFREHLYHE